MNYQLVNVESGTNPRRKKSLKGKTFRVRTILLKGAKRSHEKGSMLR